jgi:hypothetical protein
MKPVKKKVINAGLVLTAKLTTMLAISAKNMLLYTLDMAELIALAER